MTALVYLLGGLGGVFLIIAIIETVGKFIFDFPQIPYLTANIPGLPFDYAWGYAVVLGAASWGLQKMFGIEIDEEETTHRLDTGDGGIVVVDAPSVATWTCECGRVNPADSFNCPVCGAEQPPLSSSRWET